MIAESRVISICEFILTLGWEQPPAASRPSFVWDPLGCSSSAVAAGTGHDPPPPLVEWSATEKVNAECEEMKYKMIYAAEELWTRKERDKIKRSRNLDA